MRAEVVRQQYLNPKTISPRAYKRSQLAQRARSHELGLSNPAYLAATSHTRFLRVQMESARVKFTFSDPVAQHLTPLQGIGAKRGEITELSEASRQRLANRAWALSAEGHTPEVMITLTSPANWERIYVCDEHGEVLGGGRLLKQHLEAFRKRLGRFLARQGVGEWSCLWFLEFQQRGAPHLHLMLFGCGLPEPVRRALRGWCGRAWSEIVQNPSRLEADKHRRAGTQVARMRAKHFGYAVKYATKTEQKEVPHYFREVGRFWGCWNYRTPEPLVLHVDYSVLNQEESMWVKRLVIRVLAGIYDHSPGFFNQKAAQLRLILDGKSPHRQGFTVFGTEPAEIARLMFASAHT